MYQCTSTSHSKLSVTEPTFTVYWEVVTRPNLVIGAYLFTRPTWLLALSGYCAYLVSRPTWLQCLPGYCAYLVTVPTWLLCLPSYCAYLVTKPA